MFVIEWDGRDDDDNPMTYSTIIDCCSWSHAEKRCAELGARLLGRSE